MQVVTLGVQAAHGGGEDVQSVLGAALLEGEQAEVHRGEGGVGGAQGLKAVEGLAEQGLGAGQLTPIEGADPLDVDHRRDVPARAKRHKQLGGVDGVSFGVVDLPSSV